MLPSKELAPWYGKVTWLFVTRNFKSDAKDLEALRSHDRFGVTSWPQMLAFDPRDDAVLTEMPRDLQGFQKALDRAMAAMQQRTPAVPPARSSALPATAQGPLAALAAAEAHARALALEELAAAPPPLPDPVREQVLAMLLDEGEDFVVRVRALRLLAGTAPELVSARAAPLLGVANDPFRFQVLSLIEKHPNPGLAPLLARMFAGAGEAVPSRNPNVLRIHLAKCLGASGDGAAVTAMEPVARAADPRNGLTRAVLQALGQLGARLPQEKAAVLDVLGAALPPALPQDAEPAETRRHLHVVTGVLEAFALASGEAAPALPKSWGAAERAALQKALAR